MSSSLFSLFKRATIRAKWAVRSFHFLKEQLLEQNEQIALFTFLNTRAICSLWKSHLLYLRVGFAPFWRENWKLYFKIYITLFGFASINRERFAIRHSNDMYVLTYCTYNSIEVHLSKMHKTKEFIKILNWDCLEFPARYADMLYSTVL